MSNTFERAAARAAASQVSRQNERRNDDYVWATRWLNNLRTIHRHPELAHDLVELLPRTVVEYLKDAVLAHVMREVWSEIENASLFISTTRSSGHDKFVSVRNTPAADRKAVSDDLFELVKNDVKEAIELALANLRPKRKRKAPPTNEPRRNA